MIFIALNLTCYIFSKVIYTTIISFSSEIDIQNCFPRLMFWSVSLLFSFLYLQLLPTFILYSSLPTMIYTFSNVCWNSNNFVETTCGVWVMYNFIFFLFFFSAFKASVQFRTSSSSRHFHSSDRISFWPTILHAFQLLSSVAVNCPLSKNHCFYCHP